VYQFKTKKRSLDPLNNILTFKTVTWPFLL